MLCFGHVALRSHWSSLKKASLIGQSTNGKSIALDRQLDIIDIYRDCNVCHRKSLLISNFNSMKNIRFYPSVKVQSIQSWGAGLQDWTYSVQGSHLTWHKYEINKFQQRFHKRHMSQWTEHDVAPFHLLYMLSFDQRKQYDLDLHHFCAFCAGINTFMYFPLFTKENTLFCAHMAKMHCQCVYFGDMYHSCFLEICTINVSREYM